MNFAAKLRDIIMQLPLPDGISPACAVGVDWQYIEARPDLPHPMVVCDCGARYPYDVPITNPNLCVYSPTLQSHVVIAVGTMRYRPRQYFHVRMHKLLWKNGDVVVHVYVGQCEGCDQITYGGYVFPRYTRPAI